VEGVIKVHRLRIGLSVLLVLGEAAGAVVMPLLIGIAIDDRITGSNSGVIILASVGVGTTALVTVRRLHDVRLYARIYDRASDVATEQETGLSAKTARLNMLREVIDFLE
jgi:hypothetical protein